MLTLTILLTFISAGVCPVFASGSKESDFEHIDNLIEERNYTEALALLSDYMSRHPHDFDRCQQRIKKILKVRAEYAETAETLIDVILNEPENDEKKLQMISSLEGMEKNSTESTKKFIADTRVAAEFTYNRAKFEELIEKGSAETRQGNYAASLRTNYSGFELYNVTFHERGYDKKFVAEIDDALNLILKTISDYEAAGVELNKAFDSLNTSIKNADKKNMASALQNAEKQTAYFAELRNKIADSGYLFKNSFEYLSEQDPELTEASFLAFAYRFVLGRSSTKDSGMIAAMDTHICRLVEQSKNSMLALIDKNFEDLSAILSDYETLSFVKNKSAISDSRKNALETLAAGLRISDFYKKLKYGPFAGAYGSIVYEQSDTSFRKKLEEGNLICDVLQNQLEQNSNYAQTSGIIAKNMLVKPDTEDEELLASYSSAAAARIKKSDKSYIQFVKEQTDTLLKIKSASLINKDAFGAGLSNVNGFNYISAARKIASSADATISHVEDDTYGLWQSLFDDFCAGAENIAASGEAVYEKAYPMLNEKLDPEAKSHPKELIPLMNAALTDISKYRPVIVSLKAELNEAPFNTEFIKKELDADIERMNKTESTGRALVVAAQDRVVLSQRAKNEADLRFNQAEKALAKQNFQDARDYLQRSRTKYNESLLYQDSDELRIKTDSSLISLGAEINRAENELVVREVRTLKTQAKNMYYAGNFEQAELLLSQAKTRWASTNVDEDPEITALQSLVGTALSMKTGRVIPTSAPLYPEMSQILSIANQYYNQGSQLMKEGKTKEAESVLNNAKQKLRELQLVYPLNQEASLLTLRIDKLIDPDAFEEFFKQKVNSAQTDYLDPKKQQTVYADLLDLAEINPNYPGLKKFIYNVEIKLGIRVLPPDQTALRKAEQLTREAAKIYDSNKRDEITLNSALAKVNEALKFNPDNTDAQVLKDRINTALGGSGTAVLPAEAENLYQQAVIQLQQGNTLQAAAIVSKLMQNAQYRKASKILDLKKKVDSLL